MKCEEAIDLIVDGLMDKIDDSVRAEFDNHLSTCRSCSVESQRISEIWEGLLDLQAPALPAGAAVRLGAAARSDRTAPGSGLPLRVAAAVALLLVGGVGGYLIRGGSPETRGAGKQSVETSRFLLLVRGEPQLTDLSGGEIVQEYVGWADSLAEEGVLVGANKLRDEPGRWISGLPEGDGRRGSDVSGYFLIRAADYIEAAQIADGSPHIRFGGTFEIRQLEPDIEQ